MNKSELVSRVAESSNITKKEAAKVISAIIESITKALQAKDTVRLKGIGTFSVKTNAARKGRNPQTGRVIDIPAKVVPKFTPSKMLRKDVLIASEPNKEILKKIIDALPRLQTREFDLKELANKSGLKKAEVADSLEFLSSQGVLKIVTGVSGVAEQIASKAKTFKGLLSRRF